MNSLLHTTLQLRQSADWQLSRIVDAASVTQGDVV